MLKFVSDIKKDFSITSLAAAMIVVLVGMTGSAIIVFQAAIAFGSSTDQASSWLGSLCVGVGLLTIYFSLKLKMPVLMAWSTPGAVLLVSGAQRFSMPEAIGAFVFSAGLVFLFGITGWFEKIMNRISLPMTSALLAGVLLHFCLDAFSAFHSAPWLVGAMFLAYVIGKKITPRITMLLVLIVGLIVTSFLDGFKLANVHLSATHFNFSWPVFTFSSIVSLGIPVFIVTMAAQNLTGLSVMRTHQYRPPISSLITGMGLTNLLTSFYGGFSINLAAITAAIAMGTESHSDRNKRYITTVIAGALYVIVGLFAATVTSLFAAFPQAMIASIAGFALLGTVASGLESVFSENDHKEAAFITFVIAASDLKFLGIGAAFWAIVIGTAVQLILSRRRVIKN